jgi:hypothetical protein
VSKVKRSRTVSKPVRTRRRSRSVKCVTVLTPRPVAWQDPRSITELRSGRSAVLGEMFEVMRAQFGGARASFQVHRNRCTIVREEDGMAECSCVPLVLYVGATA